MPDTPIPAPFDAYTGDEPYVFVSYSHRDAGSVFPEIVMLRDRGYRIWYDEGIDPGNEWPEAVAKALKRCAAFVVYISPNAVDSKNVRDEIHFAIKHDKQLVSIHLVETEMPDGLELRIGTTQAILKYRTSASNYDKLVQRALPAQVRVLPVADMAPAASPASPTTKQQPEPRAPAPQKPPVEVREPREPAAAKADSQGSRDISAASPPPQRPFIHRIDGAEMICIPRDPFLMGGSDRRDNPRHTVTLSAYWIYKNLVTVEMYKEYCKATGAKMPPPPKFNADWIKEDHPVVNVSWHNAKAYSKWAQVDLPTEAQWERAARGTDGRKYPWGNEFECGKVWASKKKVADAGGTTAVGHYGISPCGCTDMAGNAWQWCADWYDAEYMKMSPASDPMGPRSGTGRVLRGGSWGDNRADRFGCAQRANCRPDAENRFFGFRCAVPANQDQAELLRHRIVLGAVDKRENDAWSDLA
jgi:sulfatase modifying factor 1